MRLSAPVEVICRTALVVSVALALLWWPVRATAVPTLVVDSHLFGWPESGLALAGRATLMAIDGGETNLVRSFAPGRASENVASVTVKLYGEGGHSLLFAASPSRIVVLDEGSNGGYKGTGGMSFERFESGPLGGLLSPLTEGCSLAPGLDRGLAEEREEGIDRHTNIAVAGEVIAYDSFGCVMVRDYGSGLQRTIPLQTSLAEGSVECWGGGSSGELGNGSEAGSLVPERVSGISGAVDVAAAGSEHACAIASAGGVECWGANGSGQAPGPVEGLTGPAIGGGGGLNFTCALLASGHVECWGDNSDGELGDGTTTRSTQPVAVSGITTATSLTAGGNGFACASLASGAVECWGTHSLTPMPVSGISDATAVSGGGSFVCALRGTGGVDCWADSDSLTAETVPGITDATAIAATSGEACAVLDYTTVDCWREGGGG
jgi:Regulator of chromosome condensation (RCC1) repeat